MLRFIASFFGGIFSWITTGAVMAALIVGAVFYMYGRDLPNHEQLSLYAPPTISRIYNGEGRLIDEFAQERRLFTPIEDIPDIVKHAFISAEDKNFFVHRGYDPRGMVAAALDAARGGRLRGASTITQQVMKNFLLSADRTAERKIKELILASRLEETLSKDEILELYLNEIYLGQNSYGVTAAAQVYFNKTLEELSVAEAAYLGALPQRPAETHPVRDRERALSRREYVLREMRENGYISAEEYEVAQADPLRTVQAGDYAAFGATLPPRDYFTDEIRRQLSGDFGEEEFFGGGLTIRATVDPELQAEAEKALRAGLEKYDRGLGVWHGKEGEIAEDKLADAEEWRAALTEIDMPRDIQGWFPAVVLGIEAQQLRIGIEGVEPTGEEPQVVPREDIRWLKGDFFDNFEVGDVVYVRRMTRDSDGSFLRWTLRQIPEVQGGFMAMDVETGRVLAMQGGFSYQDSAFNRATQADRQPGSSFKPFVYATALDSGFSPATIIIDAPIEVKTGDGIWRPTNASHQFYGPTPLRTGIERSRNLMTVRLAQEIGMELVAGYAERFGVYDRLEPFLANALGSQETTLFKMVAAYAMFANGGERVEPTLVDRVQNRWGETIYRHDDRTCEDCQVASLEPGVPPTITDDRERVMNAITAYQLTSMMQGVVQRGTAAGRVNLGVPVAGKTGTTNDAKDVWFIGFTSNIVAGCYMGYDRPKRMPGASGGAMCAPVFDQFMKVATEKYGGGKFDLPPGGHFIKIDRFTGARLPDSASGPNVVAEYFRSGEEPVFGVMFDGGWAMGSNLPLFGPGEGGIVEDGVTVETADGEVTIIPEKADFGTLSSGGLY
ncbi:PBP1A family penicillin-binding protein [Psychromarinibacter sp. C21-152]|uniref:Penicillin-binding protein 1A n=1 Tax=Psychromarinibacter sediminicola TaxID=3033385 RepID=A0AAE3NMI3_9RHOB|nr:PBP1A family penicillin-binding protein [Psychromarinibacter sediminicola]MDF0600058.1 PBP1A family penicillin-binding protein [Psychromarinibacter sediminicola]